MWEWQSRRPFYFPLLFAFLLFLFFSLPLTSAQENGGDESNAAIKDLGRRSKIFVDIIKTGITKENKDPINLTMDLDSGLGFYDAFFASLSVIIVGELATHKIAVGVAVGAAIGHTICTSLAVIGGSLLASNISQHTVAAIGGLLFLGFSTSSYFYP